jgi:hypothetical protein
VRTGDASSSGMGWARLAVSSVRTYKGADVTAGAEEAANKTFHRVIARGAPHRTRRGRARGLAISVSMFRIAAAGLRARECKNPGQQPLLLRVQQSLYAALKAGV